MLRILVMKRILLQYLEGHVALKSRILTAEHHSHPAFAQAFDDTISAERLTNHGSSGMARGDNVSRSLFRRTEPGKPTGGRVSGRVAKRVGLETTLPPETRTPQLPPRPAPWNPPARVRHVRPFPYSVPEYSRSG